MKNLKVVIAGCSGRMGRALLSAVQESQDCDLFAALERTGSQYIGHDAGVLSGTPCGIAINDDLELALQGADVLIDFTRPEATLAHLAVCRRFGVNMIVGTTGFSPTEKIQLEAGAADIGIVFAPNMSVGVNVLFKLLETAARALSEGYDIEIIETHHRYKVDAPSGTALRMGEVIADTLGRDLKQCAVYGREGVTGERDPNTIGFATIRAGDVVGDHTALFAGIGERIEITHKSSSRSTYAQGALRAARFLATQGQGLFDMQDVLRLRQAS